MYHDSYLLLAWYKCEGNHFPLVCAIIIGCQLLNRFCHICKATRNVSHMNDVVREYHTHLNETGIKPRAFHFTARWWKSILRPSKVGIYVTARWVHLVNAICEINFRHFYRMFWAQYDQIACAFLLTQQNGSQRCHGWIKRWVLPCQRTDCLTSHSNCFNIAKYC